MSIKQLKSRVRRLEQAGSGGHCQGCNELGAMRMFLSRQMNPDPRQAHREPDWSTTDLARCPVCGNPDPRISLDYVRSFLPPGER